MPGCTTNACTSGGDIRFSDKSLYGVHRFQFEIEKDGVAWDTATAVHLTFYSPSGTESQVAAVQLSENVWYYDTTEETLDEVGYWSLDVQVHEGAVVLEYPYDIQFRVRD